MLLKVEIPVSEVRRVPLTQDVNALRRHDRVGAGQLRRVIDRLGLLQIESVKIRIR